MIWFLEYIWYPIRIAMANWRLRRAIARWKQVCAQTEFWAERLGYIPKQFRKEDFTTKNTKSHEDEQS